jgi:stage II sporulation protein D
VYKQGDKLGTLKGIKVMRRGASGKAMEVEILTTSGCYRVYKELVIRRVFQKNGISLPSANVVFEKELNKLGNITKITAFGGGFGHGVGMSQFGAGYMATKLHQPYYNILRHYYTGINLGTMPVTVCGEDIKQTFWAPIGRAHIVVTDTNAGKISVMINGKDHEFPIMKSVFQKEYKIDISRFIEDGENTIVYHTPSLGRSASLYVELVEKYGRITGQNN